MVQWVSNSALRNLSSQESLIEGHVLGEERLSRWNSILALLQAKPLYFLKLLLKLRFFANF